MTHSFTERERLQSFRLRGTNQQTNTALLYQPPDVNLITPGGLGATRTLMTGIGIGYAAAQNRSGSTIITGVGGRLVNRLWTAGTWTNAVATPFVDATSAAQSTTANAFTLESLISNDGYVIASPFQFNAITINVGTASAGGAAVRALRYTNAAGTGWINLAAAACYVFDAATGDYSTGEQLLVFDIPIDWGQTQAAGLSGILGGLYAINVRATTAPGATAALASGIEVWRIDTPVSNVTDQTLVEFSPTTGRELLFREHDALGALFSVANAGNRILTLVRPLT